MSTIDTGGHTMTTNINRAAEILHRHHDNCNDAADALADAGLIAPELPEANDPSIFVPGGKGWLLDGAEGPVVWTAPGGTVMVQRIEPGELTPESARDLAHALLAAADHTEEVGTNE